MSKKITNYYLMPFGMSIGFLAGALIGYFFITTEAGILLGLGLAAAAGMAIRRKVISD